MLFLRVFQHLLPRALAWRTTVQSQLRQLFEGLAGQPEEVREYADEIYGDAFPATTRELTEWEDQFGLASNENESVRRQNLAAEWAAGGGQSPAYIQGVLQTAGFNVYVHEWWSSGPGPYVVRDPHDYTDPFTIGTYQCTEDGLEQPACFDDPAAPYCNEFLANDPHYFANKDLTPRPPPPIPDDSDYWPYFIYIGAETFPDIALIPAARRGEFERLLLKLRPAHNWIVTLVQYGGIFDDTFSAAFG